MGVPILVAVLFSFDYIFELYRRNMSLLVKKRVHHVEYLCIVDLSTSAVFLFSFSSYFLGGWNWLNVSPLIFSTYSKALSRSALPLAGAE